jgi:hypothetical protein
MLSGIIKDFLRIVTVIVEKDLVGGGVLGNVREATTELHRSSIVGSNPAHPSISSTSSRPHLALV